MNLYRLIGVSLVILLTFALLTCSKGRNPVEPSPGPSPPHPETTGYDATNYQLLDC